MACGYRIDKEERVVRKLRWLEKGSGEMMAEEEVECSVMLV